MKPLTLEFCGINSFSEPASIDFSKLLEYGIFGIFGDTGSGKSTILDCIGFALYGNVARSRSGSIGDVINFALEKAYVHFSFEISFEGRRRVFRVERELKRKNAAQSVKVYEKEGDKFVVVSDGVRESNALLERIIGLEQRDFEKCIALPQGEFAQFVRSTRADRLKLVSRLFDLEEYGDRLVKRANARYSAAEGERKLAQARLEPYEEVSEENNAATKARLEVLESQEKAASAALETAREREKRILSLFEKAKERASLSERAQKLSVLRPQMASLEAELGSIEKAASAVTAERDRMRAENDLTRAENERSEAEKRHLSSAARAEELSKWDEGAADEELSRLTERLILAEQAEKQQKRRRELERDLNAARSEYAEEAKLFKGFSYEEERAALEEKKASLGAGNYLAFLEERGKPALLREEYLTFAAELTAVHDVHPEAEELLPLIEKYTALSREGADLDDLREAFSAREKERENLSSKLLELEKKGGLYRAHLERLSHLQETGVRLKEELASLAPKEEGEENYPALLKTVNEKKRIRSEMLSARERAGRELSASEAALRAAQEKLIQSKETLLRARERAKEALLAGAFSSSREAEALIEKYGDGKAARAKLEAFKSEDAAVTARFKELSQEDLTEGTEENAAAARDALLNAQREYTETARACALARDELRRGEEALSKKRVLEAEAKKAAKEAELSERLKKLLEGNKFMDFVAEEYLQNVAQNASSRLLSLTDGRYFLRYEGGGGGFTVGDNLNGGKTRGVYTLSGGETFLVSLSLALSLSQEICLRSLRPIEFFFLDEGFGTLDEHLVDTVMDSLERLKGEHFSIGIISHVEELKHRIEKKLIVKKATETHGSQIIAE